jgi:hypothetical protein
VSPKNDLHVQGHVLGPRCVWGQMDLVSVGIRDIQVGQVVVAGCTTVARRVVDEGGTAQKVFVIGLV